MSTSGRVDVIAWRWLVALSNALRVERSSMSPTWADSQTYRSAPTENVFFRSPPTARAGITSTGKANGMGAKPRDRRTGNCPPAVTRTTESSQGT